MSKRNEVRVLRIINRFNLGGPTFNVAYLTRYLDAPFTTKLVGGEKDESEASSAFILDEMGLEPEVIPAMKRSISPMDDWKAYRALDKLIKAYRPHIVHTHASKSGTLGRLAAINNGVPIILHTFHGHVFHSYFGALKTRMYKAIERSLAKRSTRIIAISKVQKQELGTEHRIAPPEKIEVVPLGFDLQRFQERQDSKRHVFRTRYKLQSEDVAIGIIGRLVPIKFHEMFLECVSDVLAIQPRARFFIVGDGERREELMELCDAMGLRYTRNTPPSQSQPICFTSWIKEVDRVMAGLDVVALTSLNEGTPVSLIEAQSAAKPVVSTRVGGVEDIVDDGKTGFLCPVRDQQTFVQHLCTLANDASLRAEMGAAGREHVVKHYHYERLVHDMRDLYLRLLKETHIDY